MAVRKTAVSIEETLFARADSVADDMGISRSELYARALDAYLQRRENEDLLSEVNEAYSAPETAAEREKRGLTRSYMKKLAEGTW